VLLRNNFDVSVLVYRIDFQAALDGFIRWYAGGARRSRASGSIQT